MTGKALNKRDQALQDEFNEAFDAAETSIDLVQPTEEERRNGWTAETLTAYLTERRAAQEVHASPMSAARFVPPSQANSKYSPFKWRR